MTTITMKEVAAFLLGEAPLDGFWFGERHPAGGFWWREHLRAALSAPATAPEHKPMHKGEIQAAWLGQDLDEPIPYIFALGIRSVERFNGIKEKP